MRPRRPPGQETSRDLIALVLAVGLATALNVIVAAILYDAIHNPTNAGISENATQILTGWGGGIIGVLGAVFGFRAGASSTTPSFTREDEPSDEEIVEDDEP